MKKTKSIRRLIATGVMTAFTAASLITTSYAFVTLNTEATVSEFGFDIVDQEGLLISTDGNVFFQDITADEIKTVIKRNAQISSYDDLRLTGVTLGGRTSTTSPYAAGLYTEDYQYQIGGATGPMITDKRLTFVKDKVTYLDVNDAADASAIAQARTNTVLSNLLDENDRIGVHSYEEAKIGDYIFFDLWLRVAQVGDNHPTYKLKFSERTKIEGNDQDVLLYNSLATTNSNYSSGQKITVNPADAMRLGVNVLASSKTNQDSGTATETYTLVDSLKVFEPNEGLGSYAVSDGTNATFSVDKYKPSKNAMYTYHNNLNPLAPFVAGVENNGQLETLLNKTNSSNESVINDSTLATFTWNDTTKSYNVVKMSVMLWLEGWDADYIVGINNNSIQVKLGFEIEE